jgi:2-keto-4-pentenoate hydratase/2-oxohepta-3-ene-1,7-dioic acid hydratase in catechol pathway
LRLVTYVEDDGGLRAGVELGSSVVDAAAAARVVGWGAAEVAAAESVRGLLTLPAGRLGDLADAARANEAVLAEQGAVRDIGEVRLAPPVPDPEKIICLGMNYADHAAEANGTKPSAPMFFAKFPNSLVGPADPIVVSDGMPTVDYEGELAVVIGCTAKSVTAEEALSYVAGAMVFNDVSERTLQVSNPLWTAGKAIDTFGPCGPALVLMDELDDLQDLGIRTRVNGAVVQDGSTASMLFGMAEVIAHLSSTMTLVPGDIIATGTPAGVGFFRDPQLFLHAGDVVEVEIDQLGTLRNEVIAAAGTRRSRVNQPSAPEGSS